MKKRVLSLALAVLMALSLLPKDENKAVCQSYYGRGYSDSPKAIADELRAMGHEVTVVDDRISMGRGQIIWRGEDGVYTAGTEPRCDGAVAAW